jgi:4'-phosphopantetheinyl transferase
MAPRVPAFVAVPTVDVLGRQPIDAAAGVLNRRERSRMESLRRPSDRADYLAAHLLARALIARVAGVSPRSVDLAQRCAECCSDAHGRPRVVGQDRLPVSWSHTAGAVAVAVGGEEVGVDAERVHDQHWRDVCDGTMTPAERDAITTDSAPAAAFTRLWVRKEALVKIGRLRLDDLRLTSALTAEPLSSHVSSTGLRLHDLWCLESRLELPGGDIVLVAVVADRPPVAVAPPEIAVLLADLVGSAATVDPSPDDGTRLRPGGAGWPAYRRRDAPPRPAPGAR